MNYYISYLNDFNRWLESNSLESVSQLMYFKLLNVFNRAGWPESVQVDNPRLMSMTGCASEKSARAARDRLISSGLISYQRGKKGIPGRYFLIPIPRPKYGAESDPDSAPNAGQNLPGNFYPANFTRNMGSNQGTNRDVIAPEIAPPYKEKEEPKNKKDVSNRKVSSRNETGILSEVCAKPPKAPPAPPVPPVFQIPLNDNSLFDVTADMVSHWRELYPAVDVEQELRKIIGWCEANPQKRKTKNGVNRFVTSWLSREQDRGGTRNTAYQGGYGGGRAQEVPYYARNTRMNPDGTWEYDPGDTSGSL